MVWPSPSIIPGLGPILDLRLGPNIKRRRRFMLGPSIRSRARPNTRPKPRPNIKCRRHFIFVLGLVLVLVLAIA